MKYHTIFLLDDNETANFYNTDVIRDMMPDAEVIGFCHPCKFIEHYIANHSQYTEKVLLLLDINMPQKQGFEVIEELEESIDDLGNLDIIMLTSSSLKVDKEKATRFPNIYGYIEKPLTEDKLNKAMTGLA